MGVSATLKRIERCGPLRPSFAQERFWFLSTLHPTATRRAIWRLRGPVDTARLEAAIAAIVRRQESLRTTFAVADGRPVLVISESSSFTLPVVDLADQPDAEREARRRALDEARRPFDLENGPLFRPVLYRIAADEFLFTILVHHAIWDPWSQGVFQRELRASYDALTRGASPALGELPIQSADVAAWQRAWLVSDEGQEHCAYWREHLTGAPPVLKLPTDQRRPSIQQARGGQLVVRMDPSISDSLTRFAQTSSTTRYVVLFAAYVATLARSTAQRDIVVGVGMANRGRGLQCRRREVEGLIGAFANTVPVRTSVDGAPTFVEMVRRVGGALAGAVDHQDVPFMHIVEMLQPRRDPSRTPIYQVLFDMVDLRALPFTMGDVTAQPENTDFDPGIDAPMVDLMLQMVGLEGGQLTSVLQYDASVLHEDSVRRFCDRYHQLLAAALANPEASIDEHPLSEDDRPVLPPPDENAFARDEYVAPRTPVEETLAEIWSELLGGQRVGVRDDFFALGGHSLLAIRLLAEVDRRLGVKVPLRELFFDSTLGGVAARVGQARAESGASERPMLYASATRRAPLPAALRGVFKLNKLVTSDVFGRHVWSAWIDGPLDLPSLERAVGAMRVRHALLRTRFFDQGEREMLEVLDAADVQRFALLERADVSSLSEPEREAADDEFARRVSFRPLDLGHGEVMSVALSRWSTTRHRLSVSLHNIISDGESLMVYVDELCALWRAFAADPDLQPDAILPSAPLQYHHLADYLERLRESDAGRAHRAFWTARLDGMQPLELPIDLPREEVDARREANAGVVAFSSCKVSRQLPHEVLTAIERIAESQHATVMSTLVAAMAGYLSQRTSQRDLAFITRLSHRYMPGLERALGFLVNPIVLRISTSGAPAFSELVERTHAVVNNAFDHGECDLFEIAPYSAFRFCLVYLRSTSCDTRLPLLPNGTTASPAPYPGESAEIQIGYDLVLWLNHLDDHVQLNLAYNLELFRDTTAAAFLEGYVNHVSTCVQPG